MLCVKVIFSPWRLSFQLRRAPFTIYTVLFELKDSSRPFAITWALNS